MKIVRLDNYEVHIAGYRKSEIGWLAHVMDGGQLRPAGIIELGVTPPAAKAFYAVCKQLVLGEVEIMKIENP